MRGFDALERLLQQIDGSGYGAYKRAAGEWYSRRLVLALDHVQGDPFAAPSCVRLELPLEVHGLPEELWSSRPRRVALCDFVARTFARACADGPRVGGSGGSGRVSVDAGGAEILARSACELTAEGALSLRFRVGLPARGRRVMGRAAGALLLRALPRASESVCAGQLDLEAARAWAALAEDHAQLQTQLRARGLVCFLRDGSVLPRASGVSAAPLRGAVPFRSPASLQVTLETLHHGPVTGMGLPQGVSVITGGGFHGKTTLLEAIQAGIDPHVPGDGREWVVTDPQVVKVRSEDGRSVTAVDLRPFIQVDALPGRAGRGARLTTRDASGSTSLAAAILEAHELGARALLLDEDTSATNLLVRDARMQALVERETISPLIDHVRALHEQAGVSTVLVVGGCGDYLDVADTVLLLEEYRVLEVSERARAIARELPTGRAPASAPAPAPSFPRAARCPVAASFDARRGRRGKEKIRARGLREIAFGEGVLDLGALEQLVDESQARAVGALLRRIGRLADGRTPLAELVATVLDEEVEARGLYALEARPELARVRVLDLGAAVNRLRSLEITEV